jgi:hypothetical protein
MARPYLVPQGGVVCLVVSVVLGAECVEEAAAPVERAAAQGESACVFLGIVELVAREHDAPDAARGALGQVGRRRLSLVPYLNNILPQGVNLVE